MLKAYSPFRLRNGLYANMPLLKLPPDPVKTQDGCCGSDDPMLSTCARQRSLTPQYMHVDYGRVCAAGRIRTSGYQPAQVAL
jgi:hypothetical protein